MPESKAKRGRPKLEVLRADALTDFSTSTTHALPEAVAPSTPFLVRDWKPNSGGGPPRTSIISKQFIAPLTDDAVARGLRLHELTHLKWSPADGPQCALQAGLQPHELEIVSAVEDARVNLLAYNAGFFSRIRPGYFQNPPTQHIGNPNIPAQRRFLMAAIAYATEKGVGAVLDPQVLTILSVCLDPVLVDPESFDSTVQSAKRFARYFAREQARQQYQQAAGKEHGFEAAQASGDALNGACNFNSNNHDDAWAPLKVVHVPRPHATPAASAGKTRRATDSGVVFRYPHRYLIDQRVFSSSRRAPGGTLVIDHSGSMDIKPSDIMALLEIAPHATVADYGAKGNPMLGTLRILAQSQRLADRELIESNETIGGHNAVDGPVADWLARQPGPCVWVTDGQWTGKYRKLVTDALRAQVLAVCAQAKILILPTVPAAVKYFAQRGARRR